MAYDLNSDITFSLVGTAEQLADAPSRLIDNNEESLYPERFYQLQTLFGLDFTIDAMASPWNRKCEKFISKIYYPGCLDFDFLTVSSLPIGEVLWVFPPKCISDRVASHLWKYFQSHNWALIFHRFQEWPSFMPALAGSNNTVFFKVGQRSKPSTCVPCKKEYKERQPGQHPYLKPNSKPFETWACFHCLALNIPISDPYKFNPEHFSFWLLFYNSYILSYSFLTQ